MKKIILITLFLGSSLAVFAQPASVAKSFEENKVKYTREHFVSGEDASSGFDYLYYKNGSQIVKVRSIWSASHTKELRIEDSYYDGGKLVLLQRMTGTSKQLRSLVKGKNLRLNQQEELTLADGKLVSWIENKKPVLNTDPRWAETESSLADSTKSLVENYDWLKQDK